MNWKFWKKNKPTLVIPSKSWSDITLGMFYEIQSLLEEPDDYTQANLIDLIWDIDSANIPLNDFMSYSRKLDFLKKPANTKKVFGKTIILNGKKYKTSIDLTEVKTAQFIDYTNYGKAEKPSLENLLSVFIIPVGHQYNDGYDMAQVKKDILKMDMETVMSISFFFETSFSLFVTIFPTYLAQEIQTMNLDEDKKKVLTDTLQKVGSLNSELFTSLYASAKKQGRVGLA